MLIDSIPAQTVDGGVVYFKHNPINFKLISKMLYQNVFLYIKTHKDFNTFF